MAKKYKCDAANILISWQVHRGCVVLPKSVTPSRIESNLKRKTFSIRCLSGMTILSCYAVIDLSAEDVQKIEKEAASKPQHRVVNPNWTDVFEDDKKAKL